MTKEFKIYINYISRDEWNKNFSKIINKKESSLEKLILRKIESKNWIERDKAQKTNCLFILEKIFHQNSKILNNSSYITWKNEELFIWYVSLIIYIKENILLKSFKYFCLLLLI